MTREEAIEKVRQMSLPKETREILEALAPELAESEDERIRKWIYTLVENLGYPADEAAEKELEEMQPLALAYLEKQKEQKPADNPNNLFTVIPEAELTELERAIKRGMLCAGLEGVSTTIIKETAKEVKDIICKGCTVGLDQYWKGREDARKEYEKSYTFHYPTYEPPCHHGGICTNPFKDCINCPRTGGGIGISTTSGTCKKD